MDKQRVMRRLPGNTPSSANSSRTFPAGKVSPQAISQSVPTPGASSPGVRYNIGQIPISRPDQQDQSSLALPLPLLVQRKRVLGPASDRYEEEADRVADQIMSDLEQHVSTPPTKQSSTSEVHPGTQGVPQPLIRRFSLQHIPVVHGTAVSSEVEQGIEQMRDQGQRMPATLRARLEGVFHTDFHAVRIHTNEAADRLNRAIQARAFTTDNHVFFKNGEYQPLHAEGQRILAHELTHVIQQRSDLATSPDNSQGAVQQAQIAPI